MATYTEEQKTALRNAIAQGALRVKYGDKEVEYRTLAEMEKILAIMEGNKSISSRRKVASFTKGLQ